MAMRLIDEIEAAAKANGSDGLRLVLPDYWDRIKAALEAGDEVTDYLDTYSCECGSRGECAACELIARFRAATEGTK